MPGSTRHASARIGSRALFTKQIDDAMLEGEGEKQKITAKAVKARLKEIGRMEGTSHGEKAGL